MDLVNLQTLLLMNNPFLMVPQDALSPLQDLTLFYYNQFSDTDPIFTTEKVTKHLLKLDELGLYVSSDKRKLHWKTIHLSNTSFVKSPNLSKLWIVNNVRAEMGTFGPLHALTELFTICIDFELFHSVSATLRYLYITCKPGNINPIHIASTTSLKPLYKFKLLQNLGLAHEITSIEDDAFLWATYLSYLGLTGNMIKHISAGAFNGLTNLQILDLSRNELVSVPSCALQVLNMSVPLTSLDLSRNKIQYIPQNFSHPFGTSRMLESINLADNQITNDFFQTQFNMSNSIYLSLDGNQFKGDIPDVTHRFPNLHSLSAGENTFFQIPPLSGIITYSKLKTLRLPKSSSTQYSR
jgi:Leucine-rich repeat (LRR) protein